MSQLQTEPFRKDETLNTLKFLCEDLMGALTQLHDFHAESRINVLHQDTERIIIIPNE